ncbi:MAG: hypothetical protein R2755_12125 [Acidimicrobiales bacterium]
MNRRRIIRQLQTWSLHQIPIEREAGQATVDARWSCSPPRPSALLLIAWAARSGKIGELADRVFDQVMAKVS